MCVLVCVRVCLTPKAASSSGPDLIVIVVLVAVVIVVNQRHLSPAQGRRRRPAMNIQIQPFGPCSGLVLVERLLLLAALPLWSAVAVAALCVSVCARGYLLMPPPSLSLAGIFCWQPFVTSTVAPNALSIIII